MYLCGLRFKKQFFFHTLYNIVAPLWNKYIFTKLIVALIGQLSSASWLADYLKRVTEMLRPYLETNTQRLQDMVAAATILQLE